MMTSTNDTNDLDEIEDKELKNKARLRGLELIRLIKNRKLKDASVLLEEADLNCRDEAGWSVIHYAATEGYHDFIVQLIDKGVKVNLKDKNGETPLHKAARRGHILSIVTLVALGANISKYDKHGRTPLDMAVKSRNVEAVKTLCLFGTEPALQDWSWTMEELDTNGKQMLELLISQHSRKPGYKYGSIKQLVLCISPENSVHLDDINVYVMSENVKFPFYLYCCKMQSEYSEIAEKLTDDEEAFSDTYELSIWGLDRQALKIVLTVQGVPQCSEKLHIVTMEGKAGNISKVEKFSEEVTNLTEGSNFTVVTVSVPLEERKISRFAIAKHVAPEIFSVSNEAVTIIPQMDPDSEIEIPCGTFEEESEMAVNIVETQEVNNEEEEGKALLLTNVLDLTVSNGQQPKEPIRVVIPIHGKDTETGDLVVLASRNDYPEVVDDWEIKDAHVCPDGKSAYFYIDHFSFYSVARRTKVEKEISDVVSALDRSLNRKKRVIFFLITKWLDIVSSEVLIECCGIRQIDQRIEEWTKKGYDETTLQKSDIFHIQSGNNFKIKFNGNISEASGENVQTMTYQKNRDNFHIFSVSVNDTDLPTEGVLEILQEKEEDIPKQVETIQTKSFWCKSIKTEMHTPSVANVLIESLLEMEIKIKEKAEPVEESDQQESDGEESLEEDDGEENESQADKENVDEEKPEMSFKSMADLTKTIIQGGKVIKVLTIKTKKKGYIR